MLRPDTTPEAVTKEAAERFGHLSASLQARGVDPHQAAHCLVQRLFCLFAEDVGLLPRGCSRTSWPARCARMCGVAGGWRDCWDDPDDHAQLRTQSEAIERRQQRLAEVLGVVWQGEIREERRERRRQQA